MRSLTRTSKSFKNCGTGQEQAINILMASQRAPSGGASGAFGPFSGGGAAPSPLRATAGPSSGASDAPGAPGSPRPRVPATEEPATMSEAEAGQVAVDLHAMGFDASDVSKTVAYMKVFMARQTFPRGQTPADRLHSIQVCAHTLILVLVLVAKFNDCPCVQICSKSPLKSSPTVYSKPTPKFSLSRHLRSNHASSSHESQSSSSTK